MWWTWFSRPVVWIKHCKADLSAQGKKWRQLFNRNPDDTRKKSIELGDRFYRVGQASKIYQVTSIDKLFYHPVHIRLKAVNDDHDHITIAMSTLQDRRFFLPSEDDQAGLIDKSLEQKTSDSEE